MKTNKFILNCLLITTLISNNTTLALTKSSLNRYEDFKGSNMIINDNTQTKPVDVNIEGNTLVSPMRNPSFANVSKVNMKKMKNGRVINDLTTGTSSDNNYYMIDSDTRDFLTLKNNTTYTVFISGKINFTEANIDHYIVPFYKSLNIDSFTTKSIKLIPVSNNTYFNESIVFTTDNNEMESFGFYVNPARSPINNLDVYFHVVEGDVRGQRIPYFEGIKSVAQKDGLESSITITSQNKNISDELEYGLYNEQGVKINNSSANPTEHLRSKDLIEVNPGDKLIYGNAGVERGLHVFYYDANKTLMYKRYDTEPKIIIPDNCYYIKYYHYSIESDSLQLEHGSDITERVEPLSNQKTIKLKEPLRGVLGGIKDIIVKKSSRWYIERNLT